MTWRRPWIYIYIIEEYHSPIKGKMHKAETEVQWFPCDQDGCSYKTNHADNLKVHKQMVHDIGVEWFPCDQDGCDYKARDVGNLKRHKRDIHDIDVQWHRCDQDGCDYKAKAAWILKKHE